MISIDLLRAPSGHWEIEIKDRVGAKSITCRHIIPLVTSVEGEVLLKQLNTIFGKVAKSFNALRKKDCVKS